MASPLKSFLDSFYKIYFYLIVSIILIPIETAGNVTLKALVMAYGIWLVFRKSAYSLPALIIICSFYTNSYVIYLSMAILGIYEYKKFRDLNILFIYCLLLSLLLYIVISLFEILFISSFKAGLVLSQYQYLLSFFAFFYGIIISDSFDKKVITSVIVSLIILYIITLMIGTSLNLLLPRLYFFVVPFFTSVISYLIFNRETNKSKFLLFISIVLFISTFVVYESTFTLYVTSLWSFILTYLYFSGKSKTLKILTGEAVFVFIFILIIYALNNYESINLMSSRSMEMRDINSLEALSERMQMKLFEDRAPIWAGVYEEIVKYPSVMPPENVYNITLNTRMQSRVELQINSHNLYLEIIRYNGVFFGFMMIASFIYIVIISRKVLDRRDIHPLLVILICTSLSTAMIGGIVGINFILPSFSILGFALLGLAYSISKVDKHHLIANEN